MSALSDQLRFVNSDVFRTGSRSLKGVDVHCYGVADALPPRELRGIVHAGDTEDVRKSWFVIFDAPDGSEDSIALVACEVEPRTWRGSGPTIRSASSESPAT